MAETALLLIAALIVAGSLVLVIVLIMLRRFTEPEDLDLTRSSRSSISGARRFTYDTEAIRRASEESDPSRQEQQVGVIKHEAQPARIVQVPAEDVRVEVQGQIYTSPDEIPDKETQALVQSILEGLEGLGGEMAERKLSAEPEEAVLPSWLKKLSPQVVKLRKMVESASFVDQIESLLQLSVDGDPALAGRSIHIHQLPDGIVIEMDGQHYNGIGEVPDPEVRALIQRVIQAWEES